MIDEHKYLAYFPGVKAENFDILGGFISKLLQNNADWRLKSYPEDDLLISNDFKRSLISEYDSLDKNVNEMITGMRGNLPFYNPRYIGHMLSDTSMPALIGYMAGLLYNPNNVTTEAATVTVDWEIQVCNKILEMLGYTKAPEVDISNNVFDMNKYKKDIEKGFGWAHISSGGTLSNMEALWVARNIKYTALAIRDVAIQKNLNIQVRQTNGVEKYIHEFEAREILLIKPQDAIELLYNYFGAVAKKLENLKLDAENIGFKAWEWINQSKCSLNKGTGHILEKYPPVIFVSGAGHYSIDKAADILGIGKENVQHVRMDSQFRMDMEDLEKKIMKTILQGKIPLAVIAIAGTTEEGAVDPVHKIAELRNKIETDNNTSFWLHIDGAWGGYLRTLFTPSDMIDIFMKISKKLSIDFSENLSTWNKNFFFKLEERLVEISNGSLKLRLRRYYNEIDRLNELIQSRDEFDNIAQKYDIEAYLYKLGQAYHRGKYSCMYADVDDVNLTADDKINFIRSLAKDKIKIQYGAYEKEFEVNWGDENVLESYLAFPQADSITIDAHKMGYVPYSCGIIAYKDDRVRTFIQQKAPYITGIEKKCFTHTPQKYVIEKSNLSNRGQSPTYSTTIDSFAPFTLEGSRAGAAACSLWLAEKTIPLTLGHHGKIVKSTLMAARELFEWISRWNETDIFEGRGWEREYEIIPMSRQAPDTNVINFIMKNKKIPTLEAANEITEYVYRKFSGLDGDFTPKTEQPFYITKTRFDSRTYPYDKLMEFFHSNRIDNVYKEYSKNGLFVLRVTIMNPYIHLINKNSGKNYFKEFMEAISQSAENYMIIYENEKRENKV